MFTSEELIFRFNEDNFQVAVVSKNFKKITLKSVDTFIPVYEGGNLLYNSEENINQIEKLLSERKVKSKKAKAVISLEGIITRLIETPFLGKKDLKKFISNNLSEYFTVNLNDYYFDYKVISSKGRKNKKLNVVLCAFPRTKLNDIYSFVESCDLDCEKITIYPDSIASMFQYLKEQSVAVLDLNENKNIITILDNGNIFLYSTLQSDSYGDIEERYNQLVDNIGYFLNFYSTRHFGNRVNQIYLIGEKWQEKELYKSLESQFDIEIVCGISDNDLKIRTVNNIDVNMYCDIVGCSIKEKNDYKKSINFTKAISENKKDSEKLGLGNILLVFTGLSILLWIIAFGYFKFSMMRYDTRKFSEKIKQVEDLEKNIKVVSDQNKKYQDKEKYFNIIEEDNFNYISYLEALKNGLPNDVSVNEVFFDRDKIDLSLNINSPLDKAKLVIAINKMNIFEHIEIDSIKLDDSEKEVKFTLKIVKPL